MINHYTSRVVVKACWTSDLTVMLFPYTRNLTPHCLSSSRCIKWVLATYCWGNSVMDLHPIQGGVAILSVRLCYRNRDKLRPCGLPVVKLWLGEYPVTRLQLNPPLNNHSNATKLLSEKSLKYTCGQLISI